MVRIRKDEKEGKKRSKSKTLEVVSRDKQVLGQPGPLVVRLRWNKNSLDPLADVETVQVRKHVLKKLKISTKKFVRSHGLYTVPSQLICKGMNVGVEPMHKQDVDELLQPRPNQSAKVWKIEEVPFETEDADITTTEQNENSSLEEMTIKPEPLDSEFSEEIDRFLNQILCEDISHSAMLPSAADFDEDIFNNVPTDSSDDDNGSVIFLGGASDCEDDDDVLQIMVDPNDTIPLPDF